ncbi:MAG: peroxiredoxin [Puniceicoccaceae bacterium]
MKLKKLFAYTLVLAIGSIFSTTVLTAGELGVGDKAPAFSAKDQDGKSWKLKKNLGDKHVVVYFYPAAMTGGCTKQACSYRDFMASNPDPDFIVVGISGDNPEGLKYFQQANNLNFPLLSDPDGSIAKAFGVPVTPGAKSIEREVGGKQVTLERTATAKRWTFVIDKKGKIVYKDNAVKATEDLQNVLAFIKG